MRALSCAFRAPIAPRSGSEAAFSCRRRAAANSLVNDAAGAAQGGGPGNAAWLPVGLHRLCQHEGVDELLSEFAPTHVEGSRSVAAFARDELLEKQCP